MIFVLIVFIGVLALTTFVTKWVASYQKNQGLNRNLEIIEAIRLTNNKYVEIVRAGEDRYFVVAVGKDEVTLLGEISSEQLKDIDESVSMDSTLDFKSILEKFSKKEKN
ncbi:MAG: flagellar biosynthetic protein FliO [Pseudobutyrivibrio sp.]|nr:flagellar biosynthetic protein FliO [Pseudobutyrivibrio sp.]